MSYGLIYTMPFAALDDTACVVEIEKEGYTGASAELVAGESPFTVEIGDEEFLYVPTRFSTAKLRVVGGDYLQALFSTDYRQVRITFKRDGVVTWCGYVKPEVYTQDYTADVFEFEVECVSAMSVLDFIDYTMDGASPAFVSLWSLLEKCVEAAGGKYTAVHVPHVYAADASGYAAGTANVLQQMTLSEQNFFDEDGEPMTLLEVLEEVCKFLGWTCADWAGELWFVDADATAYRRYASLSAAPTDEQAATLSVQAVGFAGSGHSMDIMGGYNKATVKCSNYPVGEQEWSLSLDGTRTLASDTITDGNDRSRREIMSMPEGVELYQYTVSADGAINRVTDLTPYMTSFDDANALFGALPFRFCNYEMESYYEDGQTLWKPGINDYNFTDALRVRNRKGLEDYDVWIGEETKLLSVKLPCAAYTNGVICINGEFKFACDDQLSPIGAAGSGTVAEMMRKFSLRIGNQWYDGGSWQDTETMFNIRINTLEDYASAEDREYFAIPNDKTPDDPYDGASGYIVRLPGVMSGELELCMYSDHNWWQLPDVDIREVGTYVRNLSIGFVKLNGSADDDTDRIYENVVNEDYINELDEIELKISSWNDDGACYSKVMLGGGLLETLYNVHTGGQKRPEELLITRIINHYSHPNVKLGQPLKYTPALTPAARLTDQFQPGRTFINAGGSIDYRMNRFECTMIEL